MEIRSVPYVPPTCPAVNAFEPEHTARLKGVYPNKARFSFDAHDCDTDENGDNPQIVEILAFFADDDTEMFAGGGESLLAEPGSDVAEAAYVIREDPLLEERMRTKLCDRVTNCRMVEYGVCSALSATAVREVILEVANEQ